MQLIDNHVPVVACHAISTIAIALLQAATYLTRFIAYERYMYFCKPLVYITHLSQKKVAIAMLALYIVFMVYNILATVFIGRVYYSSAMLCELPSSAYRAMVNMLLFRLVPAALTIFCCVKIWNLIRGSQVAPALPSAVDIPQATPTLVKQAQTALKMILMTSGALWATYIFTGHLSVIALT